MIVSVGLHVAAKNDFEICILSIIKTYGYFSFVFLCCVKKSRVVENIESDVAILKILTTFQKS